MANPYTGQSISGYNQSPPEDDGSQTSTNEITWAKHKTKLADPIKTLSEAIDTAVSSAFEILNVTAGTATASKGLVVDASKDIAGLNIVTAASFVGPLTGAVTGDVTGNVTGNCTGSSGSCTGNSVTATTATNFSGSLVGDVTGTQGATVVGNDSHNHTLSTITDSGALAALNSVGAAQIDANAVGDSEINFSTDDRSSWSVGASSTLVVPAGLYMCGVSNSSTGEISFDIRTNAAAWSTGSGVGSWEGGAIMSDGTNFRFRETTGSDSVTVYYRKLS